MAASRLRSRVLPAALALWSVYCLYLMADRLWTRFRMRQVPVEVVRSGLVVDAQGQPAELEYTLRLDLLATAGSERAMHIDEILPKAAYPEEAYDELLKWSPGTRHTVVQVRGDARDVRLTGDDELSAAAYYFAGAIFSAFLLGITRQAKPRTAFLAIAGSLLACATIYAVRHIPKILNWPMVTPTEQALQKPDNVTITLAAERRLQTLQYKVIAFSWNGTTIHGGIGPLEGPYDELKPGTPFWIDPQDRWSIAAHLGWNAGLFVPCGFFLLLAAAFWYAARASQFR